jgi:hypothetical protein
MGFLVLFIPIKCVSFSEAKPKELVLFGFSPLAEIIANISLCADSARTESHSALTPYKKSLSPS